MSELREGWKVVEASIVDNQNIQIKTENLISVIDENNETVAICGRKEPMQLANAKLIAAAPEMLERLEELISVLKSNGFNNDSVIFRWNEFEKAEQIIKKATL